MDQQRSHSNTNRSNHTNRKARRSIGIGSNSYGGGKDLKKREEHEKGHEKRVPIEPPKALEKRITIITMIGFIGR